MAKKYVLANGAGLYTQNGSTEFQIAGSSGLLYSEGTPVRFGSGVETVVTGNSELPTLTAYGVSLINALAGANSSALTVNLAAPVPGVRKSIVVNSTAALTGNLNVDLGSASLQFTSSDAAFKYISFSTAGTYQSLDLIGMSTSKWAVLCANSTVGVFGVTGGIVATTAFSS